jgi:hypothetical protein
LRVRAPVPVPLHRSAWERTEGDIAGFPDESSCSAGRTGFDEIGKFAESVKAAANGRLFLLLANVVKRGIEVTSAGFRQARRSGERQGRNDAAGDRGNFYFLTGTQDNLAMAIECPRCRLTNPETAQRCDCGYDFETKTVQTPYSAEDLGGRANRLKLPYSLYGYAVGMLVWFRLLALLGVGLAVGFDRLNDAPIPAIGFIAWVVVVLPLSFEIARKKRWANTLLAVLTMPWGIWLLTSQRLRVFLLQRHPFMDIPDPGEF